MALIRALTGGGGGGSSDVVVGTEIITTGTDSVVSLDFVPTLVITEVNNGSTDTRTGVWDSTYQSGTKVMQMANNNGTAYAKTLTNGDTPTSSNCLYGCLCKVDTTNKQITIRQSVSSVGTSVKWIAYK